MCYNYHVVDRALCTLSVKVSEYPDQVKLSDGYSVITTEVSMMDSD